MVDSLGGVTIDEIEAASKEMPFPDNAGASAGERFVMKISSLVTIRQDQGESGGVAVFLRSDFLDSDAEGCNGTFYPFLATGNDPICNQVWLSNAVLGGAYALDVDCSQETTIFEQIRSTGFGKLPALVIDWRGAVPAGRYYARGVEELEYTQEVALAYSEITEADIKDCLDHFHRTSLQTPLRGGEGHSDRFWTKPAQGWPAHRPEERIQGKLIEHLRSRFTKHDVRGESKKENGITDLLIYARTQNVAGAKIVVSEWVLELKALTDRTESGGSVPPKTVKEAIDKGLTQAIAYRQQEHARKAALCCYDMRTVDEGDESCFAEIREEAAEEGVLLWRWFLFRSSEAFRQADRAAKKVSAALKGQ